MSVTTWLRPLKTVLARTAPSRSVRKAPPRRMRLEPLEDRTVPTTRFSAFDLPFPDTQPNVMTTGPDGAIWFQQLNRHAIGRITMDGQVTEIPLPAEVEVNPPNRGAAAHFDSDGTIWFGGLNNIYHITQQGNLIQAYPVPSMANRRYEWAGIDVAMGPDGNVWYM